MEMYLAGVSVRRVEDVTEALWGIKTLPGIIPAKTVNSQKKIRKKSPKKLFFSTTVELGLKSAKVYKKFQER